MSGALFKADRAAVIRVDLGSVVFLVGVSGPADLSYLWTASAAVNTRPSIIRLVFCGNARVSVTRSLSLIVGRISVLVLCVGTSNSLINDYPGAALKVARRVVRHVKEGVFLFALD